MSCVTISYVPIRLVSCIGSVFSSFFSFLPSVSTFLYSLPLRSPGVLILLRFPVCFSTHKRAGWHKRTLGTFDFSFPQWFLVGTQMRDVVMLTRKETIIPELIDGWTGMLVLALSLDDDLFICIASNAVY